MIVDLAIMVIAFVVCYNLAKKNNMSPAFTFLGFFGIIGIVAMVLIIKLSGNNYNGQNSYNGNDYTSQNNYNGNNYTSQNSYDGNNYTSQNSYDGSNYNSQNSYNRNNYGNGNAAYNDGGYSSQNERNQYHNDDKFKKCPKCGAKIEKYASFCSYCGKEF